MAMIISLVMHVKYILLLVKNVIFHLPCGKYVILMSKFYVDPPLKMSFVDKTVFLLTILMASKK
jgi:hypothetical protein